MARYYRRRYRTIVRAPKKRWCTNMFYFDGNIDYGTNNNYAYAKLLVQNSTEGANPSPVIIKTGNFKVQFDVTLNVAASGSIAARAFIAYVPEGYNVGLGPAETFSNLNNLVSQHPEWILVWKQLDFGNANAAGSVDTSVVRMSSRLKRNLNTGDNIYFFVLGNGDFNGITARGVVSGACQYWTCAN